VRVVAIVKHTIVRIILHDRDRMANDALVFGGTLRCRIIVMTLARSQRKRLAGLILSAKAEAGKFSPFPPPTAQLLVPLARLEPLAALPGMRFEGRGGLTVFAFPRLFLLLAMFVVCVSFVGSRTRPTAAAADIAVS
jgi:hypothetical protein